jgi:long-chain acyl-CoA synthetase
VRPALSEGIDPLAHPDPVAAVLAAHDEGVPLLLATSGSTGGVRRLRRTTASWFDSFPTVTHLTGLDRDSQVWVPGPPAGTMNLFAAVLATAVGASLVTSVEEATHAHLTPTALRHLLDVRAPLGGLHLTVAGDRLGRDLHDDAVARGAVVAHYYGAAELSFVAWGTHDEDLRPFPGVEVRDRAGVLHVRSPYLAGVATDVDGFATVGDHGTVTADGYVVVRGRGDTAVLTGGATVLVEDVEAALRPAVTCDLVVVGVPHLQLGEVVAAVLTEGDQVAPARERAREALGESQRPRLWFEAPEVPRSGAGKPDRAAVRASAAAGELRRVSPVGAT